MYIKFIEGSLENIRETIDSQSFNNLYVRIGEKVKVRSKLCEVVDIVHYPDYREEDYKVEVFVKVIEQLSEPSLVESVAPFALDALFAFLNRKKG